MHDDLRGVLDALLAITISEALAKPIARRFGRWILAHAESQSGTLLDQLAS